MARTAGDRRQRAGEPPDDPEQPKARIEQTREQLGQTAGQLVAKTDVEARA
jgi:Protein of unknown function (DUF3618)